MMKFFINMEINISFLKIDTIILGVCDKACPKYPKQELCISLQYLQKNVGDEVEFFSCR